MDAVSSLTSLSTTLNDANEKPFDGIKHFGPYGDDSGYRGTKTEHKRGALFLGLVVVSSERVKMPACLR